MIWRGVDLGRVSLLKLALDGESGRKWYADSRAQIESYCDHVRVNPDYACDVLAILSPRVTVEYSIRLADRYLRTGSAPGAMRQRLAALAEYETSGLFNGPKVNAFSSALRGDTDAVVIDAWMYRAVGETTYTPKTYKHTAGLLRAVANQLGWPPSETQAAVWKAARAFVGYREEYSPMSFAGVLS
jgi:hypothetical protein